LSERLNAPVLNNALVRTKKTRSLAHIGQKNRWKEVDEAFQCGIPINKETRHLLLVDDVITTGATLSACAKVLLKNSPLKLSIVSLACRL